MTLLQLTPRFLYKIPFVLVDEDDPETENTQSSPDPLTRESSSIHRDPSSWESSRGRDEDEDEDADAVEDRAVVRPGVVRPAVVKLAIVKLAVVIEDMAEDENARVEVSKTKHMQFVE
ncbi:uncharacterized protein N7487_001569 [Penicillium crustosum]|uniref:uncharacterized protein n=1 Tax=Penicillium crustosum TaxID=36656 RepID=UPI00238EB501|nr:uncharacterized protein N7487_001569 [Penicillium crustosum]KAJ5418019.1 hypothetical protein N7487_001569 [Penicillium crustosum]